MFLRSQIYGFFKTRSQAELTALKVTLATALCKLITAGPTPGFTSVPGDFTEATFGGYAAVTLADWIGPVTMPNGEAEMIHSEADFSADNTIVPPGEVVTGFIITNAAGTELIFGSIFAAGIPFIADGDNLSLDVIFGLPFSASTGAQ